MEQRSSALPTTPATYRVHEINAKTFGDRERKFICKVLVVTLSVRVYINNVGLLHKSYDVATNHLRFIF